jgi:hypothetical protein
MDKKLLKEKIKERKSKLSLKIYENLRLKFSQNLTILSVFMIFSFLVGCVQIPSISPMAKIHKGMSRGDVIDILDAPSSINQIPTWRKIILPWKTENDCQTVYCYSGLGQISFNRTGKQTVQSIDYNPHEIGIVPYSEG